MLKATAPYFLIIVVTALSFLLAPRTTPQTSLSVIRDATVLEYTPDFTDLYIIQIQYKGKPVRIYCNASSCYKQRSKSLLA